MNESLVQYQSFKKEKKGEVEKGINDLVLLITINQSYINYIFIIKAEQYAIRLSLQKMCNIAINIKRLIFTSFNRTRPKVNPLKKTNKLLKKLLS